MDQKHDSRKRSLSQRDDDSKDLEEHRNCPNELSAEAMDVDTEKEGDTEKRRCYRCNVCYLSFADSQNLEDHVKEICLKIPVADPKQVRSYEACMDTLRTAMTHERYYFRLFERARLQTDNAVKRYSTAKQQKDYAHQAHTKATIKESTLCTTVSTQEQGILSHLAEVSRQNLTIATQELENATKVLNLALHELMNYNHIAMFAANKVDFAYSETIQAFKEHRFDVNLSPEAAEEERNKLKDVLNQRSHILTMIQNGVKEIEAFASVLTEIETNFEEPKIEENTAEENADENGRVGGCIPNTVQEVVGNVQSNQMDVTIKNVDDPKPSTS